MSLMTPEVVAWVESTVDGTMMNCELQGRWRPHYFVDVKTTDATFWSFWCDSRRDPELVKDSHFPPQFTIEHESTRAGVTSRVRTSLFLAISGSTKRIRQF